MGQILRSCAKCAGALPPAELVRGRCPTCRRETRHSPSPWREPEYRRNRRKVLVPGARCALNLPGCETVASSVDHIRPVAQGGSHEVTNLQPACDACQHSKAAMIARGTWPDEWPDDPPPPRRPGGRLR